MADLAAVFHWPPSEMDGMDPAELLRWHELARERGSVSGGNRG
ncbi:GpE family phage tail protein [Azospirillum doebereinerae]|uniref:GpE family phage tail protein n=1 Tax=Azospirillum doebereinerae TaxID=92933 RepID=A0A3S0WXB4_9PROT|nr:GpE family phage tail protein [Azospirillum doebereinerae]RUQ74924.1 GpE family phage tail protein [Azospirillum doebereinerae]